MHGVDDVIKNIQYVAYYLINMEVVWINYQNVTKKLIYDGSGDINNNFLWSMF